MNHWPMPAAQVPQLAALRHNDAWHLAAVLSAVPETHPQLAELAAAPSDSGGGAGNGAWPDWPGNHLALIVQYLRY